MTLFEAVNHSMTTLSTGGYSTSDQSMSHFSNSAHWIGTVFMFLGGLPFLLYVQSLSRRDNSLLKDARVRGFFWLVVWVTVVVTFYLWLRDIYGFMDALRISCFNIVSVLTTTGFGLGDFGTGARSPASSSSFCWPSAPAPAPPLAASRSSGYRWRSPCSRSRCAS